MCEALQEFAGDPDLVSFKCSECGFEAKGLYDSLKRENLKRHKRVHRGTRPFACKLCTDYTNAAKENVAAHIKGWPLFSFHKILTVFVIYDFFEKCDVRSSVAVD